MFQRKFGSPTQIPGAFIPNELQTLCNSRRIMMQGPPFAKKGEEKWWKGRMISKRS